MKGDNQIEFIWLDIESMKIVGHEINGIIFDLDGTLFDSCGLWHQIDVDFFAKRGLLLPDDYAKSIAHLGLTKAATYTKTRFNLPESEEEIINEWNEAAIEMYTNHVNLKPYAKEYLEYLKRNGIKLAIATANSSDYYMPCLIRNNIEHYFDTIWDVSKFKGSKESPEIYIKAAKELGVEIKSCAVFEDIPTALKTAKNAGFITVAVDDASQKEYIEEKKNNSHLFIQSFNELL